MIWFWCVVSGAHLKVTGHWPLRTAVAEPWHGANLVQYEGALMHYYLPAKLKKKKIEVQL